MKFHQLFLFLMLGTISLTASAITMTFGSQPLNNIRSQIVGEFNGWGGNTIFKLSNGQWWQQTEPGVWNYHAVNPYVDVYFSNGCQRLQVEGQPYSVCVKIVYH